MKRFSSGGILLATACLFLFSVKLFADENQRPNIVVIMADDIGFECLSCYGSKMYETPNIDKLASSGIRFNHAHSQPICTPSRVQIMTGIYNNRNYIEFGLLDSKAVTFGNALRDAGYKTCVAGKWQLKGGFEGVKNFGFDRHCLWQLTRRPSRYPNPGLEIDGNERDFKDGEFGPDVVTDYICKFMEENKGGEAPFLVYYPMIAPHWPFVPTPDHSDWDPTMWRDKKNEPGGYRSQKYWDAMVRHTDKMVGKVVDKLDALGIRENTLVLWTGDNGTYTGVTSKFNGSDYKGGKGTPKDNGTHVGFTASWPAKIKPGQVSDDLVDFSDVFPTLLDVAGIAPPRKASLDGVSLMPVFEGKPRKKDAIYCWYSRNGVRDEATEHTRDQAFKLYASGKFYNTGRDPDEVNALGVTDMDGDERAAYDKLKKELDAYREVTKESDPIQAAKRSKPKKKD